MTLSDDRVIRELNRNFACGWTNIKGKTEYAGSSNTHEPTYAAKCVKNSSGHHNVQMFLMTQDGRVIHCLPGFWNPDHFLQETKLAKELGKLYYAGGISRAERNHKFLDAHLNMALEADLRKTRSSELQGFDKKKMEKEKDSDFKREEGFITGELKAADQVMHERMAALPYVRFEKFDVKKFIHMGLKRYKYDTGVPGKDHRARPAKEGSKKR